jgi:hypothetical protein
MKIIGKQFSVEEFEEYLKTLDFSGWKPELIVVHHCAAPNLAQRPKGFIYQHILNLQDFYEGKGWSAGPHLFTDDNSAWVFSPLTARGVHAVSFNRNGIGIEMLGDYDSEDPKSGRGLAVVTITAKVVKLLMRKIGKDASCIRFHRDDPKTSKTCPGTKITKEWFLEQVAKA